MNLSGHAWPPAVARTGVAVLTALAAIAAVFTTVLWTWRHGHALPYWDQWDFLRSLQQLPVSPATGATHWTDWLAFLWSQHNEHRIATPRLFFLVDHFRFDGSNRFLLATNLALQALTVAALWRMARDFASTWTARTGMLAAIVVVLASASQGENFLWGFQVQFIGVYTAAAWAALLAMQSRWVLAIAAGVVCTLMMSNGVVVWPMLLVMALLMRARAGMVMACLLAGVVCIGAYLWNFHTVPGHTPLSAALSRPHMMGLYVLVYLGGHAGLHSVPASAVMGALYMLAYGACLWALLRGWRQAPAAQVALLGLASFVLAAACLTASGRVGFGLQQALSGRYATPSAVFAVAVLLSAWGWLRAAWAMAPGQPHGHGPWPRDPARAGAALALLGAATLVMSQLMHYRAEANWRHRHHLATLAASAIASGVADRPAIDYAAPSAATLARVSPWLRTSRKSIFATAPWSLVGQQIGRDVPLAGGSRCQGTATMGALFAADGLEAGRRWTGWAWDTAAGARPAHIALAAPDGTIVAIASRHDAGVDRPATDGQPAAAGSGWAGAVAIGHTSVQAFGLVDGLSRACALTPP